MCIGSRSRNDLAPMRQSGRGNLDVVRQSGYESDTSSHENCTAGAIQRIRNQSLDLVQGLSVNYAVVARQVFYYMYFSKFARILDQL